jgi:hypothetical protein
MLRGLVERVEENVGRFAEDEEFAGVLDVEAGF